MPVPTPRAGETRGDFIARCAGDKTMNDDYPHTDQRVAICYRQWRDHHGKAALNALAVDAMRTAVDEFSRTVREAREVFDHG